MSDLKFFYAHAVIFKLIYLFLFCSLGFCQKLYIDKLANYDALMSLYTSDNKSTVNLIPKNSSDDGPMLITVTMEMYTLNDFDEIAGNIEIAAALRLSWTDEIVTARTGMNTSSAFTLSTGSDIINSLVVPYNIIWTPKIVLYDAAESFTSIESSAFMCRYYLQTGDVLWKPKVLINSGCSPDVTYYPFDRQTCTFSFVPWGFTSDEILFITDANEWDLSSYKENGEWDVIETQSETAILASQSQYRLTITIQRKSLYYAFNILLPVLALCILNGMVFWLPVESGERVGFSITCFLSFMVLLNMIMDILPRSSSPMSYLCYYLVVMMLFSGFMTSLLIIQIRVYNKPETDEISVFLKKVIRCCRFEFCRKPRMCGKHHISSNKVSSDEKLTITDVTTDENMGIPDDIEPEVNTSAENRREDQIAKEVTWKDIGNVMDKVLYISFLSVQMFFTVTFLFPLGYRA